MKKLFQCFLILALGLSSIALKAQMPGAGMYNPIVVSSYYSNNQIYIDHPYSDTQTYGNGFGWSGWGLYQLYYQFAITADGTVDVSTCSSTVDSYVQILDSNGNEVASNDDDGPLCTGTNASLSEYLSAGAYYVVISVPNDPSSSGQITTTISSDVVVPPPLPDGWNLSLPKNAGSFGSCTGTGSYTDAVNNNPANRYGNEMGQPSDDVYYSFDVISPTTMNISLAGSNFNTYVHLLHLTNFWGSGTLADYTEIAYNDDNGPLSAGTNASIQQLLPVGHYVVVAEGSGNNYGDMNVSFYSTPNTSPPPGRNLANAINAGTLTSSSPFSNSYTPTDCYDGACYYKFTLNNSEQVSISNCGSSANSSILRLLNKNGQTVITANMHGPLCADYLASIKTGLPAGTYYVAASGFIYDADIITTISIAAAGPAPVDTTGLNLTCSPLASAPSANQNYVRTYIPRIPIDDAVGIDSHTVCEVNETVEYYDGLGRPLQTVLVNANPSGTRDIIKPIAYDEFGREATKYLSYTIDTGYHASYRPNALGDTKGIYANSAQLGFYAKPGQNYALVTAPFAGTIFEASPENRPLEQGAPGEAWQLTGTPTVSGQSSGHTVKMVYTINDNTTYTVKKYGVTINSSAGTRSLIDQGTYDPAQLFVTIVKDENWSTTQIDLRLHTTEEYKDKDEHLLLKRTYNYNTNTIPATFETLSTYYVYDDIGSLSFVLPPKAEADGGISNTANQPIIDNLCYQYLYDETNRLIAKRIPGSSWQYTVYNQYDQVVATQDGNQRAQKQWLITKYDALGRVILTGLWNNNNTDISPAALKLQIDLQGGRYESKDNNQTYGYTLNNTYPTSLNTILAVNYYDTYNFPVTNPYPYTYNNNIAGMTATNSGMTQGLVTATRTTVLNTIGNITPDMLWTINYYDDYGRNIQTNSQHYLGGVLIQSNYDELSNSYDFSGSVTQTIRNHYNITHIAPVLKIANIYVYDHVGRKRQTWEQINSGHNLLLSQLDYNEIDQLYKKKLQGDMGTDANPSGTDITLGTADAVTSGQKAVVASHSITLNPGFYTADGVTFSASIERQFLQTVTYAYNERGWLRTANTSGSLFNLDLRYEAPDQNQSIAPQYNGNISQMGYNVTKVSSPGNRQFAFGYDALNRLTNALSTGNALDETIAYDKMGNITNLTRGGTSAASLSYNYLDGGGNYSNQLESVNRGISTYRSYTYDDNGNAKSDGISQTINYNILNLPKTVIQGGVTKATYTYEASGTKIRNTGIDGTWDYVSGIVYKNNDIEFVQTEEGRAIRNPSDDTYRYEYNLKDHLGNTRVSFDRGGDGKARVIQEDEYYSFGLRKLAGYDNSNNNRYLYNGKEAQTDLDGQYDYGSRFYDGVIARFSSIDIKAEESRRYSSYVYAIDNPIRFVDKDGEGPGDRVKAARQMVGSPYKQETETSLRINKTEVALDKKDCSEFVMRALAADGITNGVQSVPTANMKDFFEKSGFVHSMKPQVGDVALWQGHTGIVTAVDSKGNIKLIAGRGLKKPAGENPYFLPPSGYRDSEFYGYYRPDPEHETPDGKDINVNSNPNGSKPQKKSKASAGTSQFNFETWLELNKKFNEIRQAIETRQKEEQNSNQNENN
jgi:RHS repeat-associated protein